MQDYWQKQLADTPLFPDILWSRPENKLGAGKLTILGGNAHGFGAPGVAYNVAEKSGVGVCKVILPDAVKKVVSAVLHDADFGPSTPSGSFAKSSLGELLHAAQWSDACLLAGDFGRNSETAIVLEQFVLKYSEKLILTQDAVDYFKELPLLIVDRPNTLLVLSLAQLQKFFINTPTITPILYSMSTMQLAQALHDYTLTHPACIVTKHNNLVFVACGGKVVTHKHAEKVWRVSTAARMSVFWLQNPQKIFESVVSALLQSSNFAV